MAAEAILPSAATRAPTHTAGVCSVKHRTSNIEHRTSNIEHRTCDKERPCISVGRRGHMPRVCSPTIWPDCPRRTMAFPGICAVVLTHARPPQFLARVNAVPHLVTTDNVHASWPSLFIDTSPFANTERSIGRHTQLAIQRAFDTFAWCNVVCVLEDDVEPADDYFDAVRAAHAFLTGTPRSCFTCINDLGYKGWGHWNPRVLKPVTHSIGIGFALSKDVFRSLVWGVEVWDGFLRATAGLVCLVPEVSRCRHHAHPRSTHGIGYESKRLQRLMFSTGHVGSFLIAPVPLSDPVMPCNLHDHQTRGQDRSWRGSYLGVVAQTSGGVCRLSQAMPVHDLRYTWVHGPRGESCQRACRDSNMACSPNGFADAVDLVAVFRRLMSCAFYGSHIGTDLPATTSDTLAGLMCIVPVFGSDRSTCSATHPRTRRVCPCFTPSKHNVVHYL